MENDEARTIRMETALSDRHPLADMKKRRGKKAVSSERKSGIDKGLDDLENGRIYHAENSSDLLRQILG